MRSIPLMRSQFFCLTPSPHTRMSAQQLLLTLEQPAHAGCGAASCSGFVERSLRLQRILRDAGHRKGSGVSNKGIRLVSRVAKRERIRDWPHTRSWADYDVLIAAVTAEIGIPNSEVSPPISVHNT
jgi:hypothetical protein